MGSVGVRKVGRSSKVGNNSSEISLLHWKLLHVKFVKLCDLKYRSLSTDAVVYCKQH